MVKKNLKNVMLRRRGIRLDRSSILNYDVKYSRGCLETTISNSKLHITSMGEGCTFENVTAYGDIRLGRFDSFSGPGIILHAEDGNITIGNFCSVGQNVSIQQFNHNIRRPTSYALQYRLFGKEFREDCDSKGDIVIEDDVWIGSNVVICSGVHIGRGAVIGAGAVVTKDVAPYTVNGGVTSTVLRMRFSHEKIQALEDSKWWNWSVEKIRANREFFLEEFCR